MGIERRIAVDKAKEEPRPKMPEAGGKIQRAVAPETTATVRAAKAEARGKWENLADEAEKTSADGAAKRTAWSTPEAQPTRIEPPEFRTAATTGWTG